MFLLCNLKKKLLGAGVSIFIAGLIQGCGTSTELKQTQVKFDPIDHPQLVGSFTKGDSGKTPIIVLGGSEGRAPIPLAKRIAAYGNPTLALAYHKSESLPQDLELVPLEYFDTAITWLKQQADSNHVFVAGWSKGGEAALLIASEREDVTAVIAIAPSSVAWAGILRDNTLIPSSSWARNGKAVDYVPYAKVDYFSGLLDLYSKSYLQIEAVKQAIIPTENINGPVLLLSGEADSIWPSTMMAEAACKRMKESEYSCTHFSYPDAGHLLDESYEVGGTKEANAEARVLSNKQIKIFLTQLNSQS